MEIFKHVFKTAVHLCIMIFSGIAMGLIIVAVIS